MAANKSKNKMFWTLQITGWTLVFLLYLVVYYRNRITDPKVFVGLFLTYFTGFIISLLLRYFYKKINYKSRSILHLSITVLVGTFIASNIWRWLDMLVSLPLHGLDALKDWMHLEAYIRSIYSLSWELFLWSTLYFVIKFWQEWVLEKERTEKANALAQSAQLQMLRYQLNPHFLFNSLNSIRALIEEDKASAKAMITELAEFLRYSLVSKNYSDVPLNEELEAIRHYLAIEKKRFEEKLQIKFDIDPMAEDYPVLSFLIHPLVENAIKYGMQTSPIPLVIQIKADIVNGSLVLEVCNSGKWVESSSVKEQKHIGTRTGLENIRQRLDNAFPNNHRFNVIKNEKSVRVKIEINTNTEIKDAKAIQSVNR